jgi:hypothetical protein
MQPVTPNVPPPGLAPPGQYGPIAGPSNYHSPYASPQRNVPSISLEEFCDKFGLSETDRGRLEKLEFVPGDHNVDKLEREDWAGVGFTGLSWARVLDAHRRFMRTK